VLEKIVCSLNIFFVNSGVKRTSVSVGATLGFNIEDKHFVKLMSNKNLAIANGSRVSSAHNVSRASMITS